MLDNRQNLRCRVVGENNYSENGSILYDFVEFEDYLRNVGLGGEFFNGFFYITTVDFCNMDSFKCINLFIIQAIMR